MRLVQDGPYVGRCCLCGRQRPIAYCPQCGHDFCDQCRAQWFRRGIEAVKALIGRSMLYCGGSPHGV